MKCPCCDTPLTRIESEASVRHRCGECGGNLVSHKRLDLIQRRRDRTIEQLKQEVETFFQHDSAERLRCPRCRGTMSKDLERGRLFYIDWCTVCSLVWLDGGELAMLQLRYQDSDKGQEEAELQRRLAAMTDEQKAEFQANLAKMQAGFMTPGEMLLSMFDAGPFKPWWMHLLSDDV
jgi:Zn-finger nucleic acid-binding protein